jgi:hypothetical protein
MMERGLRGKNGLSGYLGGFRHPIAVTTTMGNIVG